MWSASMPRSVPLRRSVKQTVSTVRFRLGVGEKSCRCCFLSVSFFRFGGAEFDVHGRTLMVSMALQTPGWKVAAGVVFPERFSIDHTRPHQLQCYNEFMRERRKVADGSACFS